MTNDKLAMMKSQLDMIKKNPDLVKNAIASGCFVAGFGGELNGIDVPKTFITGKLPPDMTVQQAFEQVVEFMKKTISKAESAQRKKIQ